MTSCTIIISHYESLPFLHAAIRQIKKYTNPEISTRVIICDQSLWGTYHKIVEDYVDNKDISVVNLTVVRTEPLYSGFGIDWIIRHMDVNTDYVCQLHVDAFPIHKNWLLLPISLIEEYNLSFVGQLQFVSDGTQSIYPPSPIFAMAQCFNVARTETYRELSLNGGFTRFHNRPQSGLSFANNDWELWAKDDYNHRGSDDDVVAFSWQDRHKQDSKLGLAITGYVAPNFGRLIEEVVFHFGSCRESIGTGEAMGALYRYYTEKINSDYNDNLIEEMVELAKANKPSPTEILTRNYWDGVQKKSFPPSEEINKRIEELKSTF